MNSIFPLSEGKYLRRSAEISADKHYRYFLTRAWKSDERGRLVVIGLNPSTADAYVDDPTIRRCVSFAELFGCDELVMLNLFAFRTIHPKVLKKIIRELLIGPENDEWLSHYFRDNSHTKFLAAWGRHGSMHERDKEVLEMARRYDVELMCLGKNGDGSPRHPLYVPSHTKLEAY